MEPVNRRRIFNLVQFIFNNYVSEEHKHLLLFKYNSKNNFDEVVDELTIDVYKSYKSDENKLNFYLSYLIDEYKLDLDLETLKKSILDKLCLNSDCFSQSLEENHEEATKTLMFICQELNKRKVDYCVLGSIPIYIKLGLPLSRFHSDIDIAINSKDMKVLEDIFKDSDYEYIDNRKASQKFFDYNEKRARGGHEIVAQNKNNDFSIGFFEFERLKNGSIIKKDYFSEVVEGKLIKRVCKNTFSKEFVELFYSHDKLNFNNVEFRYCTVEGMYVIKQKNYKNIGRNRDLYDVNIILENYELDKDKVEKMKKLFVDAANYKIEEIDE